MEVYSEAVDIVPIANAAAEKDVKHVETAYAHHAHVYRPRYDESLYHMTNIHTPTTCIHRRRMHTNASNVNIHDTSEIII